VGENFRLAELLRDPAKAMGFQQDALAGLEVIQSRLAEAKGTATSDDERIKVVWSEVSGVEQVSIDPRAMRAGSDELAAEVTRLLNQARDDARRQAEEAVRAAVAAGAPDPQQVIEQLPGLQQTMEEVVRDAQQAGEEIGAIAERIRRLAETA
jgi:hypothetical protein